MTLISLLPIVIIIVVIYFFVKLIVSPLIRIITGIIIFLIIIFVLQNFFNIDFTKIFGPLGKYLNFETWNIDLNGIINLIGKYVNQALSFFRYLVGNTPSSNL